VSKSAITPRAGKAAERAALACHAARTLQLLGASRATLAIAAWRMRRFAWFCGALFAPAARK